MDHGTSEHCGYHHFFWMDSRVLLLSLFTSALLFSCLKSCKLQDRTPPRILLFCLFKPPPWDASMRSTAWLCTKDFPSPVITKQCSSFPAIALALHWKWKCSPLLFAHPRGKYWSVGNLWAPPSTVATRWPSQAMECSDVSQFPWILK